MELVRAREIVTSSALDDAGSFYGSADRLSMGTGLVVAGVDFPFFNATTGRFSVRSGLVYVLSHECDLDAANDRILNGAVLICPIIQLSAVISDVLAQGARPDELGAFLGNVAARRATRCVYMPPIANHLPDGGIMNLNLIASTALPLLQAGQTVAAITETALVTIDMALQQHLRREKAERLPLAGASVSRSRTIKAAP